MSYLHEQNPQLSYAEFMYISQGKVLIGALFSPVSGFVTRKFGLRVCLTLGSLFQSVGYLLSYFTIDWGFWPLVFTMAFMHGIGYGLIYPSAVGSVLKVLD